MKHIMHCLTSVHDLQNTPYNTDSRQRKCPEPGKYQRGKCYKLFDMELFKTQSSFQHFPCICTCLIPRKWKYGLMSS